MTLHVPAPDGRLLEVLVSGPDDGFPLVFHHGTPQAAVPDPLLDAAAAERGLRVVACSRPGYGGSTRRADGATTATVADDAADVAVILDHLGLGEFVSWAGPAAVPGPWPAPRCCPTAAAPRCAASGSCRPRSTTATSAPAWARRTSRSSPPRWPGRPS